MQLADCGPVHAQHTADENLVILVSRQAVKLEREVRRMLVPRQAERVEIGRHMPAHTVEPHQRHRLVRQVRCVLERLLIGGLARVFGGLLDRLLHLQTHLRRVHRAGKVRVRARHRFEPLRVPPRGARLRAFLIGEVGDEVFALLVHGFVLGEERAPRRCSRRARMGVSGHFLQHCVKRCAQLAG